MTFGNLPYFPGWRPLQLKEKVEKEDVFVYDENGLGKKHLSPDKGEPAYFTSVGKQAGYWDGKTCYPFRRDRTGIPRRIISSVKHQPLPLP